MRNFLFFLDEDMVEKYKKRSGFVFESPIKSFQYEGSKNKLFQRIEKFSGEFSGKFENLNSENLEKVAEFHKRVGGHYGIEFWKGWAQLRTPKSFFASDAAGNVIGFISGAPVNDNRLRM